MARLLTILFIGLVCEAIGVVLLSRGLKEIGWFFTGRDIRDLNSLTTKLATQADPVSQFIWQRLSPAERSLLAEPGAPSPKTKQVLGNALNRLLLEPPLYDDQRYAQVPLSAATRERLNAGAQGNERIELNRLLLEDAYPAELQKQQAEPNGFSAVAGLVGRGVTNAHILLGVFFEALFFVGLLMLMSKADVSFVWPLTSLSFVVTTIAAKTYLHEQVSPLRWSGVCLIMLGAALITWTEKQQAPGAKHPHRSLPRPASSNAAAPH